jgi:hypothetical protein
MRKPAMVVMFAAGFGGASVATADVTPIASATVVTCLDLDEDGVYQGSAPLAIVNPGPAFVLDETSIAQVPAACAGYQLTGLPVTIAANASTMIGVEIIGTPSTPSACTFAFASAPASQVFALEVRTTGCVSPAVSFPLLDLGSVPQDIPASNSTALSAFNPGLFDVDLGELAGATCEGASSCQIDSDTELLTVSYVPAAPRLGRVTTRAPIRLGGVDVGMGTVTAEVTAPNQDLVGLIGFGPSSRPRALQHAHPQAQFMGARLLGSAVREAFYFHAGSAATTGCTHFPNMGGDGDPSDEFIDCTFDLAQHALGLELHCQPSAIQYYFDGVSLASTVGDEAVWWTTCAGVGLFATDGLAQTPVDSTGWNLGDVTWGRGQPATQTFVVRAPINEGADVDFDHELVALAPPFSIGAVVADVLDGERTWTFDVTYDPGADPGAPDSQTLALSFGDGSDVFDLPLQGTARTAAAVLTGDDAEACAGGEAELVFELKNTGEVELPVSTDDIAVSTNLDVGVTSVSSDAAIPGTPVALTVAGFAPAALGVYGVDMEVGLPLSGGDSVAASAVLKVVEALAITPSGGHDFGQVPVGDSASIAASAMRCDGAALALGTVVGDTDQFAVSFEGGDGGAPLVGTVAFTPTHVGTASVTIDIDGRALTVIGEGVAPDEPSRPAPVPVEPFAPPSPDAPISYYSCTAGPAGGTGGPASLLLVLGASVAGMRRRRRRG